jgi:hypothetical protein
MTAVWLIGAVLAVATLEACLLSMWVAAYYRAGVRVARASVSLPAGGVNLDDLATECQGTLLRPRLAFKQISTREIAFQETVFPPALWNPIPVLRGLVVIDPTGRRAEVLGILLWYPLVAVGAIIIGLASEGIRVVLLVVGGAACAATAMGAVQWWHYSKVLQALHGAPEREAT